MSLFKPRALGMALGLLGLLLMVGSLAAEVNPAGKEPIAYIGHGAMFDAAGHEVAPSLAFLRTAQAWYRDALLVQLTPDQRQRFGQLESRLRKGLALNSQAQLILNAHLLEWMIQTSGIENSGPLLGKIRLMKLLLSTTLPESPRPGADHWIDPFKTPARLQKRLDTDTALKASHHARLVTANGGAAYRAECLANGVPVPPDWGTSGWVSQGTIPSSQVFITASLQAEVYTYQSSSPLGMCIALPRYDTFNSIKLLGVICLGKTTSKACFWDNDVNGVQFFPNVGDVVPFANFGGGIELAPIGGVCPSCHAGENPYIIHPATALGTLAGLGLPTFPNAWHDPIVKAGWPQNPGPMNAPAACVGCHTAGGPGGRFPHLSNDPGLAGYCGTILPMAIANTMPPGSPGSAVGAPTAGLLNWCTVAPGGPASNRGDPHLTTVGGVHYDFQSAGEFVALRDADGLEVQTRQTPVSSASPVTDSHSGLTSCVSLNSAVAVRVNKHRVSFEPNLSGQPDPSGLQLRVDGVLTKLGTGGLSLGSGSSIVKSSDGNGIVITFPDGAVVSVLPAWWGAPHNRWYLNVEVANSPAREGILGTLLPEDWLPLMPDGSSLGALPATLHQRYLDLNQTFANAWRVTDSTSLFDYAPGTSTATFTLPAWPPENPPCILPNTPVARPLDLSRAQAVCRPITDSVMNADCVTDVSVMGNEGFAALYQLSQAAQAGTTVKLANLPTQGGDEKTRCPKVDVLLKRADASTVPYLGIVLPTLDQHCKAKGAGLRMKTVKFLSCNPNSSGKGTGRVAYADITCAQ